MNVRSFTRRYGDSLLAGVLTVLISAELLSWVESGLPTALACGVLATVPLAWRRKLPLVSFVLVMLGLHLMARVQPGFDNDSSSFVVAYLVTLYSRGRHASGIAARWGAAGVAVVMVLFNQSEGGVGQSNPGDVAFLIGFVGAPWAAGLALRLRNEREAQLNEEKKRLLREQEGRERRAVAEERARIARELHDVVAHAISVTVLQARGARRAMDIDPGAVRQALDAIERLARPVGEGRGGVGRHAPVAGGAPGHRLRGGRDRAFRPGATAVTGAPRPAGRAGACCRGAGHGGGSGRQAGGAPPAWTSRPTASCRRP